MSLSYVKQIWRPRADPLGETKFTSARMNHMEDGIQGSSAPLVTQLPSAANGWAPFGAEPGAGQEVILRVNDGTGHPLAMWRMVYVPGETYPWYYAGGSELVTYNPGADNIPYNGGWYTTGDSSLTVPSVGDYDFDWNLLWDHRGGQSGSIDIIAGVRLGATNPASATDCIEFGTNSGITLSMHAARNKRYTAVPANTACVIAYSMMSNVGNVVYVYRRTLRIKPFRLA